uniref:Putative homing endonuclease n=1 Tax=viral metagenome TaxID=1070528 RepID=A0A6M3XT22_9ZZZZ
MKIRTIKHPKDKKYLKSQIMSLIRELIVLRDGEKCLRCGKTERLQMSHIYPRGRYGRMALDPDNIKLLCFACHLCWYHKNPIEAKDWLDSVIPKKRLQRLKLMSLDSSPNRLDRKLLKIYLESEIKRLKAYPQSR